MVAISMMSMRKPACLGLVLAGLLSGCAPPLSVPVGSGGTEGAATGGSGPGAPGSGGSGEGGGTGSPGTGGGSAIGTGGTGVPGTGGAGTGSGGRGTGGASTGSGGSGVGGATPAEVCPRWTADRANLSEGTWSGAVANCVVGDLSADARANALRLVNLYRWLAALPPVDLDPVKNQGDQACALMMRANNTLSHTPPSTWTCFSQAGADAAGSSNISGGQAVSSVDAYMIDSGNPTTIGHRRWILSNSLGPIGVGGTDRASCMWTLNGTGRVGKAWMAWPSPGTIPLAALTGRGQTVDTTGWSIQSDTINLATAVVAVTVDGADAPVAVTQLLPNYGSRYAIRFNPTGWTTQAGKTYAVAVSGVSPPINYTVQVVSCP